MKFVAKIKLIISDGTDISDGIKVFEKEDGRILVAPVDVKSFKTPKGANVRAMEVKSIKSINFSVDTVFVTVTKFAKEWLSISFLFAGNISSEDYKTGNLSRVLANLSNKVEKALDGNSAHYNLLTNEKLADCEEFAAFAKIEWDMWEVLSSGNTDTYALHKFEAKVEEVKNQDEVSNGKEN